MLIIGVVHLERAFRCRVLMNEVEFVFCIDLKGGGFVVGMLNLMGIGHTRILNILVMSSN